MPNALLRPTLLMNRSAAGEPANTAATAAFPVERWSLTMSVSIILAGKEQGTSYAVHDFLERFCNVLWYRPGDSQMVLPKTKSLAVQSREVRRAPAFAWRSVSNMWDSERLTMARGLYNHPSEEDLHLFWVRLREGGEAYSCSESLYGFCDRFWQENPKCPEVFVAPHSDWFAQGYTANELENYEG